MNFHFKRPQHNSGAGMFALGAAAAVLATASYYFFGPKGDDHRDELRSWMYKFKKDVIEKMDKVGELTESAYHDIVDSVVSVYEKSTKVSKSELVRFAEKLKDQWYDIVDSVEAEAHDGYKDIKKAAVKAIRKSTRKLEQEESDTDQRGQSRASLHNEAGI